MNSGRKQQDGEGSNVSRGNIEQTFLGVAPVSPASSSGVMPAPAAAAAPGLAAAPAPPAPLAPSAPDSSAIVAAPTIPVAARGAALPAAPASAPLEIARRADAAAPAGHAGDASLQRTALTADYLRDAREAALAQVQQRAEAPGNVVRGRAPAGFDLSLDEAHDHPPASVGTRPSLAPPYVTAPASQTGSHAAPSFGTRGFEPVPVTRAPLAESMSAALGPVAELGGGRPWNSTSNPRLPALSSRRDAAGRWLMLAAVALATVGVVSFGGKLLSRYRAASARDRAMAAAEALPFATASAPGDDTSAPGAASRALLANRPAPVPDGHALVVSATGAHADEPSAGAPGAAAPGAGATSPESQLAATAARHVLAGNYAEALPVYQQLERSSPENTSYAAMARMLKKKVGATTDTRTVAPATPTHR